MLILLVLGDASGLVRVRPNNLLIESNVYNDESARAVNHRDYESWAAAVCHKPKQTYSGGNCHDQKENFALSRNF